MGTFKFKKTEVSTLFQGMTAMSRVLDIIDAINCEGIDNTQWSIRREPVKLEYYDNENELSAMELQRHIAIWRDAYGIYGKDFEEILDNSDATLEMTDRWSMEFYFVDKEES